MENLIDLHHKDALIEEEWLDCYLTNTILGAKYENVNIPELVSGLKHLTLAQKQELEKLLLKHKNLFDDTLEVYPHAKFHIELEKNQNQFTLNLM